MSPLEIAVIAALVLALAASLVRRRRPPQTPAGEARILFPFAGHALSRRALDAALRLALADGATLVPVFIARVPMAIPLDAPLPRQCTEGMPLLELIEQRAARFGVPVDSRIERGRTIRHALREAIVHERYDRLVIAAGEAFTNEDVAWLLGHAPGEVVIIRPTGEDRLEPGRRVGVRRPAASRTSDRPLALR
jgi:nucleotide-binding universal stress UspA family protein